MKKYPLIGISIIAVVLLVLVSLNNVVGYNTVQSSNQKVIKDEIDQKELLFQTILDIARDKEIQKIILISEMKIGTEGFFIRSIGFSMLTPHVITKSYLNYAYIMGVILSRRLDASKIHSLLKLSQERHQGIPKEINAVIEKNAKLNGEITQLSNLKCDCENNTTTRWTFYILCMLLLPLAWFIAMVWALSHYIIFDNLIMIIGNIGVMLNCW
jgi:hypothetical protein